MLERQAAASAARNIAAAVPRFAHDCAACRFLAHARGHDLYWCDTKCGWPNVLARWGHPQRAFKEGLGLANAGDPELALAKQLAAEAGLRVAY